MTVPSPRIRRMQPWPLLTLAFALACFAIPALAGVENPRDTAAVQAVQFDMALVKRLNAVGQATGHIDDAPPLFMRSKPGKVQKTLDELIAAVHAGPPVEAAIKAHGFTPKHTRPNSPGCSASSGSTEPRTTDQWGYHT